MKFLIYFLIGFSISSITSYCISANVFKHLKTIFIHKWWVFVYCCKCGLIWRGIKHDMSKFSPTEFFESIKYYTGTRSPIDLCKELNGYSKAWQHHKGRNTHHYEHWTDNYDSGTTYIQMPINDAIEMICDYLAAARAYMGKNFSYNAEYNWWMSKKMPSVNAMHPIVKNFISIALYKLKYVEDSAHTPDLYDCKFNKKNLTEIYKYSESMINNEMNKEEK